MCVNLLRGSVYTDIKRARYGGFGPFHKATGLESFISAVASSATNDANDAFSVVVSLSLLELPPTQAVEFLHFSDSSSSSFKHWPVPESPSWSEHLTSRYMYKRATKKLAEAETLLVAFTEFEERFKESERARFIYKFGLDHIPTWRAEDLYKKFVAFEKQYGDKEETEDATAGKRRFQYEDEVRKNTLNYDSWFDYVTLIILRIRRLIWVWCG
ncbi:hypothetical protein HID58_034312 [Brassica napus]|uniref:Uncharacterized protein n=1 Tax=Brassica napus TaxID=3708 RepID=A0ABQ8C1P5_BRANA|nr:hypothetical protein HID58_034312 [Brassica napus]